MRRAVVTGIGVICSIGRNLTEFGDALRHGRDGAGPLRSPEPGAALWNMRFTTAGQRTGPPGGAAEDGSFVHTMGSSGRSRPPSAACAA